MIVAGSMWMWLLWYKAESGEWKSSGGFYEKEITCKSMASQVTRYKDHKTLCIKTDYAQSASRMDRQE